MANINNLMAEFGGKCMYCHRRVSIGASHDTPPHSLASRDHDIPKCRRTYLGGGEQVLSCAACNHAKGDMTAVEFMAYRETKKLPRSYIEFLETRLAQRLKL